MGDLVNGRYELLETLGQGGYGEVYRAHDRTLDRLVALKQLHALGFGPQIKERFLEEARISSQLTHPSALMIYDFGVSEFGDPYLVSELLQGLSLEDYLKNKVCSPAETLQLLIEVAGVLSEAHNIGIVHRDLKPANLYLHIPPAKKKQAEAQIKLLDFGIAKIMQQEGGGATKSGSIVGTPAYIAPEQIKDSSKVNHLCDQYSLGLVAWSALHGKRPFMGENEFELMHKQLHEELPPLEIKDEGAELLYLVIQRMCAKVPEERYQDTASLLETLETLKASEKVFAAKAVISLAGLVSSDHESSKTYTGSKSQSLKFSALHNHLRTSPTPMTVQKAGLESFMETMDFEPEQSVGPDISSKSHQFYDKSTQLSREECLDETLLPDSELDSELSYDTKDFVSNAHSPSDVQQESVQQESVQQESVQQESVKQESVQQESILQSSKKPEPTRANILSIYSSKQLILGALGIFIGSLALIFMFTSSNTSEQSAKDDNLSTPLLKPLKGKRPQLGPGTQLSRHRIILDPKPSSLGYAIGSELEIMVENRLGTPQDIFKVMQIPPCLQKVEDPSRDLYRVINEECGEIRVKVNREDISTTVRAQTLLDDVLGDLE